MELNKRYIVDENNCRIAVQIDIHTFEKIEELLENYALHRFMLENDEDESLTLKDAKSYYQSLGKD
ncbi:MAG: hypothetical protein R3E08_01520 [Thiotrichaceae bacterium]